MDTFEQLSRLDRVDWLLGIVADELEAIPRTIWPDRAGGASGTIKVLPGSPGGPAGEAARTLG